MSGDISRYAPQRELPPYAYGSDAGLPHPRRHPDGHSFHVPEKIPEPLDPLNWPDSGEYLYGVDLFNHGYYWEAHEAWEGLWIAAGRRGVTAEFLKGLIKLAASALKARQRRPRGARHHAARAVAHFRRVREATGAVAYAGLELEVLTALGRDMEQRAGALPMPSDSDVVFDRPLILGAASP